MPKRPAKVTRLEQEIRSAKRGNRLASSVSHLRFERAPGAPIPLPRRFYEMQAFWDKLDLYFRNLPIPPKRPGPGWDRTAGAQSLRTRDMLFHSPQTLVAWWLSECNPSWYWASRAYWWDVSAKDIGKDLCLTLYMYSVGRHLHALFPDHPGHFTEYGSVPLRVADGSIAVSLIQPRTAPSVLKSRHRHPVNGCPLFPVPVLNEHSGDVIYTYQDQELQRTVDPYKTYIRGAEKHLK